MNSLLKFYWNLMFKLTGRDISFDARYEDMSFYSLEFRANLQAVKDLLVKRHLAPKETAPGQTRLQIVGCEMKKVRIAGPYNEVAVQVPVEPLEDSPGDRLAHLFLPVTTEAARWPGIDIYGFPKFVADIDIVKKEDDVVCRLAAHGESILEFRLADEPGAKKKERWEFYGNRKKQFVKVIFDWEGMIAEGAGEGARFVLGRHPVAETIRGILLSDKVVRTTIGHSISGILRKPVRVEKN